MLAALNVLGRLKWPSLLAVTVLPVVCFLTTWGSWNGGTGASIYGPETLVGMPFVLVHRSGADPGADEEVTWIVRTCAGCGAKLTVVELGYASCGGDPSSWSRAFGDGDRFSANVTSAVRGRSEKICIWLGVSTKDGRSSRHKWDL